MVGQDAAVSGLLVALLCGGHVLMEGVPGTAKTLLVRTLAASLSVDTRRVQFTPDLMPGDITGSMVIDSTQAGELSFREGPVFTNLLLADEINRTPPKTQSALLEAMEEGQVSVDGVSRQLPAPFLVAATQNPVEYEGTYPLPEAQLDRFLLKVVLPIPERTAELEILRRHAAGFDPRDVRGGRGDRGRRRRPTSRPGRRAVKTVQVFARGRRLHRRHRPRHPRVAVAVARRQPARRHLAAARGPGLGLAERPRLRHPRRREVARPRQRSCTGSACAPRPSSRASTSARCSPPRSARCRSRADVRCRPAGCRCCSRWASSRWCCALP